MARPRRVFSPEFKLRMVQEVLAGQSQASVARKYELSPHLIPLWKKAFQAGRLGGEATGGPSVAALEQQIADLQRLVGKKEEQIEFLKRAAHFSPSPTAAGSSLKVGSPSRRTKDAR